MIFNTVNVAGGGSSSGGLFLVNIESYDSGRRLVCDKTAGEILDAFYAGKSIWFVSYAVINTYYPMQSLTTNGTYTGISINNQMYVANTSDSYPTYNSGGGGGGGAG